MTSADTLSSTMHMLLLRTPETFSADVGVDHKWPNQVETRACAAQNIFADAGVEWKMYRYFEPKTVGLDFEGMMEDLRGAPEGSVVVLHGARSSAPFPTAALHCISQALCIPHGLSFPVHRCCAWLGHLCMGLAHPLPAASSEAFPCDGVPALRRLRFHCCMQSQASVCMNFCHFCDLFHSITACSLKQLFVLTLGSMRSANCVACRMCAQPHRHRPHP